MSLWHFRLGFLILYIMIAKFLRFSIAAAIIVRRRMWKKTCFSQAGTEACMSWGRLSGLIEAQKGFLRCHYRVWSRGGFWIDPKWPQWGTGFLQFYHHLRPKQGFFDKILRGHGEAPRFLQVSTTTNRRQMKVFRRDAKWPQWGRGCLKVSTTRTFRQMKVIDMTTNYASIPSWSKRLMEATTYYWSGRARCEKTMHTDVASDGILEKVKGKIVSKCGSGGFLKSVNL